MPRESGPAASPWSALIKSSSPIAVITPMVWPRRSTPRAWPAANTAAALVTCSPVNRPTLAGSPARFTVTPPPPARTGGTHRPLVLSGAPPTTSTGTRKASNSTDAPARIQGAAWVRDGAGPGPSRRATAQPAARVVDLPRRSAATVKVVGAGMDDAGFAEDLSRLIGDHDVVVETSSVADGRWSRSRSPRRQRVLPASVIRALPRGRA